MNYIPVCVYQIYMPEHIILTIYYNIFWSEKISIVVIVIIAINLKLLINTQII